MEGVATSQANIIDRFNVLETRHQQDRQKITSLTTELTALKEKLRTQDGDPPTASPQRAQPPTSWLTSDKTKEQIFYESGDVRYYPQQAGLLYGAAGVALTISRYLHWYRDLPWNPRCSSVLKTPKRKVPIYRKELT